MLEAADFGQLGLMFDRTLENLERDGVTEPPGVVIADAGYWNTGQIQANGQQWIEVLVPPDGAMREGKRPGWEDGPFGEMREKLRTDAGRKLYAQRKITSSRSTARSTPSPDHPLHAKRSGSSASEWRLVAATRYLLKLHNHWIANTAKNDQDRSLLIRRGWPTFRPALEFPTLRRNPRQPPNEGRPTATVVPEDRCDVACVEHRQYNDAATDPDLPCNGGDGSAVSAAQRFKTEGCRDTRAPGRGRNRLCLRHTPPR